MRKGFTLVELSIVLVIIGLLIGGILVAQSMVGTARIQASIKQFSEFDVAVVNFRTLYRGSWPGDSTYFGGMGQGKVLDGNLDNVAFSGAIANFWPNLSQTGFDRGKAYTPNLLNSAFNSSSVTPNAPKSPLGKNASVIAFTQVSEGSNNQDGRTTYLLAKIRVEPSDLEIFHNAALKGEEAQAIDSKLDDGWGGTGRITKFGSANPNGNGVTISSTNTPAGSTYIINSAINTSLRIELMMQNADNR